MRTRRLGHPCREQSKKATGSVTILPWPQSLIANSGWRTVCWSLGLLLVAILAPINLFFRRTPADLGLQPDGISNSGTAFGKRSVTNPVLDSDDWTFGRAVPMQLSGGRQLVGFVGEFCRCSRIRAASADSNQNS